MEIIVGKNAGFCFGVKRAVDNSLNLINDNKKVYCLGELVHNNEVIKRINDSGIIVIDDINEIKEDNVKMIIRAHGVDKHIYDIARGRNIEVIDLTCPLVANIHKIAEEYKDKGYYIFLVGNSKHPEIIGTSSHCGNHYSIIETEEDIKEELNKINTNNLLVIVQTTFSKSKFNIIESTIKENLNKNINLVIKNTICDATGQRQRETEELSKQVDLMIIIGGKNSSNTKKLYEIAESNTKAVLIETANELDIADIKQYNKVGIMAGTSTPQESIDEVIKRLS